jgi:hypothetical protein
MLSTKQPSGPVQDFNRDCFTFFYVLWSKVYGEHRLLTVFAIVRLVHESYCNRFWPYPYQFIIHHLSTVETAFSEVLTNQITN